MAREPNQAGGRVQPSRRSARTEIEGYETADDQSRPVAVAAVAAKASAGAAPNISDLAACIEDVRVAALEGDRGPEDPTDFLQLRGRLEAAKGRFPPLYRQEFVDPFIAALDGLGPTGFAEVLLSDPPRERAAGLMLDMAHAILQRGERFQLRASDAFQEVVGDLYDGFLSAEDRQGVDPPEHGTTPPLVKWSNPEFGPYTWPADSTRVFGARAAVVSLPPANARRGLLAWAALGHETAGHDILHADEGLSDQLATAVRNGLQGMGGNLAEYWASRIDETASDVLGILNMGPAAAIGLVGFFRGLNQAFTGRAVLRSEGPEGDVHPADILRGYLAAETVALLPFGQSGAWANLIAAETDKDARNIVLAGRGVSAQNARLSARAVAAAIANTPVPSLENHALASIQTWRDSDEDKVAEVRQLLTTVGDLPADAMSRIFATHIVAGGVMEALANGADIPVIFDRMVTILAREHARNPVWGPLLVRHPGNIRRELAYVPRRRVVAQADVPLPDVRDSHDEGRD